MTRGRRFLREVYNFLMFFLLVAFLVTCTTMLFVSVLSRTAGIEMTPEVIGTAAKLTLGNVVLLSLAVTGCDLLRRKLTTERVTKEISEGARRLARGDYSVRIKRVSSFGIDEQFNEIIDAFNTVAEELSGVETLRSDFIATVSHEIKTPLAVITNYARLLRAGGITDTEREEYARGISDAAARMSDMITNILRLNRLENQKIYPKGERIDLGERLIRCVLDFEEVWERKGIELDTDIEEGVVLVTDGELLDLVFTNLLSNAFKFTESGGRVSVSLHRDGEWCEVRICDTGCGIDAKVGGHIFDKFYQGDTSHATEGNGLGLSLVKRIVDVLGATLSVESELGAGSEFTVRIKNEE